MEITFLSNWRKESLPLNKDWYVFGAGSYAHDAYKFIKSRGCRFCGYVVDDHFFKENQMLDGKEVLPLSTLPQNASSDFSVLYAVASPKRFKSFCNDCKWERLYVFWDCMWQYDESVFQKYMEDYQKSMELFADAFSRKIMEDYLEAKRTGNAWKDAINCTDDTYFNDLTKKASLGVYVDCGAYDGDSVEDYLKFTKRDQPKVLAIEPDPDTYKILKIRYKNSSNITCVCCGVWDEDGQISFSNGKGMASHVDSENGMSKISVRSIDSLVGNDRVSFIKMDVEGAEKKALHGARKTIERDKPILAISAYHLPEDLAVLPQIIRDFDSEDVYQLYLRHHGVSAAELVLYAIPKGKK